MRKLEELKTRMFAVEALKLLKEEYSYKHLSRLFGLPIPVISRYVNGHVLPNIKRSKKIINRFRSRYLIKLIRRKIKFEKTGTFDHSAILSNGNLLEKIASIVFQEFSSLKVDKILSVETDGIPLAIEVGKQFGVNTVIAKRNKEVGIEEFIEVKRFYLTGTYSYLYIPKGSIRKGERILIVDDVIRTGSTIEAMKEMCKKTGSEVVGVFTIISVGDSIKRLEKELSCPMKSLVRV